MEKLIISPPQYYEINGQVCPLQSYVFANAAGASNQVIVAAITGKKIRVMGWIACSGTAAASNINLKNGSGGSLLTHAMCLPSISGGADIRQPIVDSGYFETTVSLGVYGDINAGGVQITTFYVAYIP